MQNYDDVEEKVLELLWANAPQEREFMISFMIEVFKVGEYKFSHAQRELFSKIKQSISKPEQSDRDSIKELIGQNYYKLFKSNGDKAIEVYAAKFLFSFYELVFEYSERDLEYLEKQSDIIENFTCAYENTNVEIQKLNEIIARFPKA